MTANDIRRHPLRTALALFVGFAVIVVLSTVTDLVLHGTHVFPAEGEPMATPLWMLALAYRSVFAVLGCWLAARLAPARPMAHALTLGVIGVILSALGTAATWDKGPGFGPKWYPLSLVVTSLPLAWIGARLHHRPAAPPPAG